MKLSTLENIYMVACAFTLNAFDGLSKEVTVTAGYVLYLAFFPAYKNLIAVPSFRQKVPVKDPLIGALCVAITQYTFQEEGANEMCILLALSYFCCVPLRYSLAVIKYNFNRTGVWR